MLAEMNLNNFLVSGPGYFGFFDAQRGGVSILDTGRGPYYGISWSENEFYVLARNNGKGELILVFPPDFSSHRAIELGRNIDGHQIHFCGGTLYVTATSENALIRVDPRLGTQSTCNWTDHSTDINHINGIGNCKPGRLWVSLDNRKGTPSEIILLSTIVEMPIERMVIDGPMSGTHNIEADIVLSSGDDSSIWDISDKSLPRKVFFAQNSFFRGLGRFDGGEGTDCLLVGASPVSSRDKRGLPNDCRVLVIATIDWTFRGALTIPRIGQVYDLRSLAADFSHNGIACPGPLSPGSSPEFIPAEFNRSPLPNPHEDLGEID
jgi:hypothetical protein